MDLALTADKRFWGHEKPILFLGPWCIPPGTLPDSAPPGSRLLIHPWRDRLRYRTDYERLKIYYESIFQALRLELNRLHGTAYDERFWRLIIGPWLYSFIYVLYERWICLQAAAQSAPSLQTNISPLSAQWVPSDHAQFLRWIATDAYNLFIYSRLIEETRLVPYTLRDALDIGTPQEPAPTGNPSPKLTRGRIFFTDSFLSWKDRLRLALKTRLWIRHLRPTTPMTATVPDLKRRESFKNLPLLGDFEHLLKQLLPLFLPTAYLESFSQLVHRAGDYLPASTRVVVAGSTLITDDMIKCVAALQQSRGAFIAGVQHGGQYGLGAWNSDEDHELRVADRFYTWGGFFDSTKAITMDAFKLLKTRNLQTQERGPILLTLMSIPRYFHFAASIPTAADFPNYLSDVERFAQTLDKETRALLRIRRYPVDYGWGEEQWLHDRLPDIQYESNQVPLYAQLRKSRLFVSTYNSTTVLEALAANIPSVFFWDPKCWEIRPKAQPFMELLGKAGILWTTSEQAAAHVNKIGRNPASWWTQKNVQNARDRFCAQFATISANWASHWGAELNRLISSASNTR